MNNLQTTRQRFLMLIQYKQRTLEFTRSLADPRKNSHDPHHYTQALKNEEDELKTLQEVYQLLPTGHVTTHTSGPSFKP